MTTASKMRVRISGKGVTEADLKFKIICEPEHADVRGELGDFDSPEEREALEDEILERLDRGDYWAWGFVYVVVNYNHREFKSDGLGGCSFKDEQDFKENSGYYEDMCEQIVKTINRHIAMEEYVDEWAQSVEDLCAENDFDRSEFTKLLHDRFSIPF